MFKSQYSLILMFHRVGLRDPKRIAANQNMVIEPSELEWLVSNARKRGWSFVSIEELVGIISLRRRVPKLIALTFDDGYRDNYAEAYPILRGLDVPFCVYITQNFIENRTRPWWYELESVLAAKDEFSDLFGVRYITKSLCDKNRAFMAIRQILMYDKNSQKILSLMRDSISLARDAECSHRLFMTWDEVRMLSTSPLVTIGAHTKTHSALAKLTDKDAYDEIIVTRSNLERNLGREVRHLAFPFGGPSEISSRDIAFAKDGGYRSAVATHFGAIRTDKLQELYALPRLFVGPQFSLGRTEFNIFKRGVKRAALDLLGLRNE